jgi:hypothetical protein
MRWAGRGLAGAAEGLGVGVDGDDFGAMGRVGLEDEGVVMDVVVPGRQGDLIMAALQGTFGKLCANRRPIGFQPDGIHGTRQSFAA